MHYRMIPYLIFISISFSGCGADKWSQKWLSVEEKATGHFYEMEAATDNYPTYSQAGQSSANIPYTKKFNATLVLAILLVLTLIAVKAVSARKALDSEACDRQDSYFREDGAKKNYSKYVNKTDSYKTPYEILNVSPYATLQEIKSAYRRLATQYHPDKVASLAPEFQELANRIMKQINMAYKTLTQNA